uniref:Histonelysine Nmethyltransferase SETMARlike [Megachile rotundata] n=1 Tax=Lepeophtheirus salmonis TaxID=72036 RepID=A0A0K2VGI6_LEPSM
MKLAIEQKRPVLVSRRQQDNSRPHTSLGARMGSSYASTYTLDLEPGGYYIFLSIANAVGDSNLASIESYENCLSKEKGNMKSDSRWKQVIEKKGAYLT